MSLLNNKNYPYVVIRTERGDFMVGVSILSSPAGYVFVEMRTLHCSPDVSIQELATLGLPKDREDVSASAPVTLSLHRDHVRECADVTPEAEARFRALPTKPFP